ncbi:MAG: 50S ribosomal protein L10 [Patescibacteria group bacterium]
MLTKTQKADVVEGLKERLKRQRVLIFSDFRGISVAKLKQLRRALKKGGAEYKVAKKTLIGRALKETNLPGEIKKLEGEIGIAFGYGDQVEPAKVLLKFSKENETFKVLGGILNAAILGAKDIIALAKLPSREVLLAQVVGALAGPIRGLATVLQGNMRNLVVVLNQVKDKK